MCSFSLPIIYPGRGGGCVPFNSQRGELSQLGRLFCTTDHCHSSYCFILSKSYGNRYKTALYALKTIIASFLPDYYSLKLLWRHRGSGLLPSNLMLCSLTHSLLVYSANPIQGMSCKWVNFEMKDLNLSQEITINLLFETTPGFLEPNNCVEVTIVSNILQ